MNAGRALPDDNGAVERQIGEGEVKGQLALRGSAHEGQGIYLALLQHFLNLRPVPNAEGDPAAHGAGGGLQELD